MLRESVPLSYKSIAARRVNLDSSSPDIGGIYPFGQTAHNRGYVYLVLHGTKNTSDTDPHSAPSTMFQRSCFISMLIYYSG